MCTLDTQFVVDPRLTLLSPCFFLWYHLVVVYPGYANNCIYLIHFVVSWFFLVVTMEMCTPDTQTVVDPRNTSLPPGLSLWYYLLDVYPAYTTVVAPRYTSLPPGLSLWGYLGDVYPGCTNCCRPYIHFVAPLVSPYGITLEMCTLDTQTVVDPRYTLFPPGLPPGSFRT